MNRRGACTLLLSIVFFILFCNLLLRIPTPQEIVPASPGTLGTALWVDRTFEVVLQGFLLLAGVVSILLLLVSGDGKEEIP